MRVGLTHPLEHRDQNGLHSKGKESTYSLITQPFPQADKHYTQRVSLGLRFFQWEKESPRWIFSSPSIVGPFLGGPFRSASMGIEGRIYKAQTGDHIVREKGDKAYSN